MITKISTPLNLGSPTLAATTAQLRNRLPTQMRRCIPLYVGCVVLIILTLNVNLFRSGQPRNLLVRPPFANKDFPRKIWQTWKVNPLNFEQRDADTARSWTDRNPEYRYEVLTDDNEMPFVEYHFGPDGFNRPDIVNFYRDVKAAIVKADLLRYMIMYAEGGLYADIDVEALKPLHKFIPERYNVRDFDMVIGIEIDEPDWKDHPILGPKSRSFCQWTFICKPQLPVMMRLIEHIMTWLTEVAKEQKVPIADVNLDFDQIISGTGPSAFTEAIMAEMNEHNPNRKITWDDFHDMGESKIVSRTLVLTIEAFAAGQGHSNSGNHEARAALVRHHYHASNWPSKHPRYSHPAYGEVERCNWNDECVRKWDEDVANFDKLSEEEQKRVIADKERERQEAREAEERKKKKEEEERRQKEEEENKQKEEEEEEERKKEEEAAKGAERIKGENGQQGEKKPKEVQPKEGQKTKSKEKVTPDRKSVV